MSQNDSFDPDVNFNSTQNTSVAEDSMGDDGLQDDAARQRRALIFKAAIGGAVILVGLGFWLMRPAAPPAPAVTQNPSPAVAEAPAENTVAETAESLMPEPVPQAEMPVAESAPSIPAEIPAATDTTAAETDPLAWNNNAVSTEGSAAEAAQTPTTENLPPADGAQMQETPDHAVVTPATEDAVESVQQATHETVPEPPAEPALAAKDASLESRLTEIENTLALLQQKMVSREDLESLRGEFGNAQAAPTESTPRKAKKKAKKKASSYPTNATSARSGTTTSAKSSWVLKSAKPGIAWVSKKGESELRSLSIGETLPGIGRILSIAPNSNGRWTVVGTAGKIVQ